MSCPKCGFSNPPNTTRCQKCGSGLPVAQPPQQQQYAPPPQQQQQYAPPAPQPPPPQQQYAPQQQLPPLPQRSKAAAALFCFFLGLLGIHNFYLGRIGCAIAQLVLTCTLVGLYISAVWVFVDFILILCSAFTDEHNRPLV